MYNAALIVTGILFVILISGCTQTGQVVNVDTGTDDVVTKECPASCDDSNECTADLCDEKSDFECRNVPRWGVECGESGVCQDGACVERTDDCSHLIGTDAEKCYEETYFAPAAKNESTLICDEISGDEMQGKCYASVGLKTDDPTICGGIEDTGTEDGCYLFYAESKAEIFLFADEACGMIKNAAMKAECMELEEFVRAPVSVKEFDATLNVGDATVDTYFVLEDRKGRTTTAAGTLKIVILQKDDDGDVTGTLYSGTIDIKEEDFELQNLAFGKRDVSIFISIPAEDFKEPITENVGTIYLTFRTDDNRFFYKQKDLEFSS